MATTKKTTTRFAADFNAKNISIQPLRNNEGGKGKTAYINIAGGDNLFQGEECRVQFAAKPGETKLSPYSKIKLTLQLNPDDETQAALAEKLREADTAVVNHFFEKRQQVWPDKAKYMDSPNAVRAVYNPLIKEGGQSANGMTYKPSFTLQISNVAELVEKLNIVTKDKPDGTKQEMVESVVWKQVIADKDAKTNEKAPKFYLFLGKDDNGKDMYTNKVPVLRKDGTVLLDSTGNPVKRFVGPQDLVPGSLVKPVFNFLKAYQVANFGVHLGLQAAFIKPPAPKPSVEIDDASIVENYDPLVAARVLHQSAESAAAPEDAPPSEEHSEDEGPSIPAPSFAPASAADDQEQHDVKSPSMPKKRKSEDAPAAAPRKPKKASSALLEEA